MNAYISESSTGLIPTSVCSRLLFLSRAADVPALALWATVFRAFFSKKNLPLTGAPSVRRLKTYSAQSGYVYQYYFEGQRPFHQTDDEGTEFVFTVSADRKSWNPVSVLVSAAALRAWEQTNARELSSAERYAICKMALFQAFDERASPDKLKTEVRVRAADVDGIIESLDL